MSSRVPSRAFPQVAEVISDDSVRVIWFIAVTEIALAPVSPLTQALRDSTAYEQCMKRLHCFLNNEAWGGYSQWPSVLNQLTAPVVCALALLPAAYEANNDVDAQQQSDIRQEVLEFINHLLERRGRKAQQSQTGYRPHLERLMTVLKAAEPGGSADGPKLLGTWLKGPPLNLRLPEIYPRIAQAARCFQVVKSNAFRSYQVSWQKGR